MTTDTELQSQLTSLARDLILIPSTDALPQEREKCFEFICNHLDGIPRIQIDHFERNENRSLVLRPEGVSEPDILLCGHIDVIDHPQPDCYHSSLRDGRIYGPGAGDMKGADAILMELFRSLHLRFPGISVGLALTSDEEQGGADGVRFLCEEIGLRCGIVIVPDGGSLNDITTEEKGVIRARIRQSGSEAHAARPWLGKNAVEQLLDRLSSLRQHFAQFWPEGDVIEQKNHWFPTCAVTIIRTPNRTENRIPSEAEAFIDVRFPPPYTVESTLENIKEAIGDDCELIVGLTAKPTHLDPDPVFSDVTTEVTGRPVRHVRASGASDSRFFRDYGIPVNLSRPIVGNLHAIDEWIDIASMVSYYRICETYIQRRLGLPD